MIERILMRLRYVRQLQAELSERKREAEVQNDNAQERLRRIQILETDVAIYKSESELLQKVVDTLTKHRDALSEYLADLKDIIKGLRAENQKLHEENK